MHSLSKRSNLAGYRCAFVAGDPALVGELLAVRKNLGLQMPGPQQVAMAAALDDDAHVDEQHARYAARRAKLREALEARGLPHRPLRGVALPLGDAATRTAGTTVAWLAERGILVAPGLVLRPRRRSGTSGWRSPPPTSGSTPPSPASPADRAPGGAPTAARVSG